MNRMKRALKSAILLLAVMGGSSQAAHLVARDENSGLWGQVDRYINDSDTEIPSSPIANAGSTSAYAGISGATDYSSAQGTMSGQVTLASYWGEDIGTALVMNSYSSCYSSDSAAQLWAYGNVAAVVPANTCGIFFTIEPDGGETLGTPVRIQLHWSVSVNSFSGDVHAGVGSFGGNTIYVTRNVQPPVNELPVTGIVWSTEVPEVTEEGYTDQTGSFVAQIGDTIGIFMDVYSRAELLGVGGAAVDINTSMELLADELLPTLIEYPYAPGLVYDPIQNITFLKDWSAFPDIMNWPDASNAVQDFTYISNGVTYSNWRLPNTIEGSGMIGELGYLSATYGISDTYFGPFTNLLDGDYWTAPQLGVAPDIFAYIYTFSTTYGPSQYSSPPGYECYVLPVFDGPPAKFWCPADFNNDGIVDLEDFATFASYWLNERP